MSARGRLSVDTAEALATLGQLLLGHGPRRPPMPTSRMLAPLIVAVVTLLATAAHAQTEPARLTDHRRIMIGGALGGRWSSHQAHSLLQDRADWRVQVQPGITYFVADHVGVGISIGGGTGRSNLSDWGGVGPAREYELSIGPEATLELPLIDRLSLVALPGMYYVRQWRRLSVTSNPGSGTIRDRTSDHGVVERANYDIQYLRFAIALPLALHISSSLAVGFGPIFWLDVFVSQHPRGATTVVIGPYAAEVRSEPYSRTRWALGATSWIGASF